MRMEELPGLPDTCLGRSGCLPWQDKRWVFWVPLWFPPLSITGLSCNEKPGPTFCRLILETCRLEGVLLIRTQDADSLQCLIVSGGRGEMG